MRGTATADRHNVMWAIDRLTRYGASRQTISELVEAGVIGVAVETEVHTLVCLILQNNRGRTVRIEDDLNTSASDALFRAAIAPCIMLNSLPPVDLP